MLQTIRDKVVGWMIWVVLLLVGVPFAFWGVDSFFLGGGDPVVAKVDGQKIYQSQFRNAYESRYQQLQQMLGENFRADMFDKARFEKAVLDDMVQETVLRQHAQDSGYRATDAALFAYLSTIPAFQKDGKFSTESYQEALARIGKTPQKFESDLRSAMEIEQMRAAVTETAFVTPVELAQAERLKSQERGLSYATFEPAQYASKLSITPEQVQQKYEASKSAYMAPERIKLAYVELSLATLPKAQPPSEDVLKVMYDAEKDGRFSTAEERKARHILVNFGADKSAAKKKIEGLAAQLKQGKEFTEVASASSDDPGSKAQGGELGWVRRGQMVKEFEDALFGLSAGAISEPVETQFGWHLIKLDELKAPRVRPFSEASVRQELIDLFQEREAQKRYQEYQEKMEQLAFENTSSLEPVAKALDLTVQTTDWFTRAGGAGITANSAVKQAAFSPELLQDNENSKPLSLGEGRVAVVRKAEYEAPRQRALDEVKAEVEAALVADLTQAQATADADAVLGAAKGGKPLADAAKDKGVEIHAPGLVKRDTAGIEPAILGALFKLPRPAAGAASLGKATLPGGSIVVIALDSVQDTATPAEAVTTARNPLRDLLAGAEFNGYRKAVEQQISVKLMDVPQPDAAPSEAPAP